MQTTRRTITRAIALGALGTALLGGAPPVLAQAAAPEQMPTDVTIVMSLNVKEATRRADAVAFMKRVISVVRTQPGLVESALYENKNTANKPSHVHVMRWRSQRNWEQVFAAADYQRAVKDNGGLVELDAAGIYLPVK